MLKSGMELTEALSCLGGDASESKNAMERISRVLHEDVKSGKSLAEALDGHPKVFDACSRLLVRWYESADDLHHGLERVMKLQQAKKRYRRFLQDAFVYPSLVVFVWFLIFMILMIFVAPIFEEMYESFSKELPLLTQSLFWTADMLFGGPVIWLILSLPVFVVVLRYSPSLRRRIAMRFPLVGGELNQYFLLELLILLEAAERCSRQPVAASLAQASDAISDPRLAQRLRSNKGAGGLAELVDALPYLPARMRRLAVACERKGRLHTLVEMWVDLGIAEGSLNAKLISVGVTLVVALLVAYLVIGFYLPIFSMVTGI